MSAAATNAVLEFVGDGAEALSIDERLAVANMAVEAGLETGIFPADEKVGGVPRRAHATGRGRPSGPTPTPSSPASCVIDLAALPPLVALPHLPGNVVPVADAARDEDRPGLHRQLRERDDDRPAPGGGDPAAAGGFTRGRGRSSCRRRSAIYREAVDEGLLDLFVEAGAIVSTPTCGACFGGANGRPRRRARTRSRRRTATSAAGWARREAGVYLANAWVAAAAAVAGEIVDPAEVIA